MSARVLSQLTKEVKRFYRTREPPFASFIEGDVCTGKSSLVKKLIPALDMAVLSYKGGTDQGKEIVSSIGASCLGEHSVVSLFHGKPKNVLIVIDDVTAMMPGDKPGLAAIIAYLKNLKNPTSYVVFCGRTCEDKRICDLRSLCRHWKIPSRKQASRLPLSMRYSGAKDLALRLLLLKPIEISPHSVDAGIVALTWHENMGSALDNAASNTKLRTYARCLEQLTTGDYIDKLSLSHRLPISRKLLLVSRCPKLEVTENDLPNELSFTKVLTKYSTYHNNVLFLGKLCGLLRTRSDQVMSYKGPNLERLDKKDVNRLARLRTAAGLS